MQRVEVERVIAASPEAVFARYTDHAGWSEWAGVGKVSLAKEGAPTRDGVGAVRAFASAMGLREEVVAFDAPTRMAYRVVRGGFPLKDHLGEVLFEPHPQGTRIVWRVSFRSKVPFTARPLARFITRMFGVLLARFDRQAMQGR